MDKELEKLIEDSYKQWMKEEIKLKKRGVKNGTKLQGNPKRAN